MKNRTLSAASFVLKQGQWNFDFRLMTKGLISKINFIFFTIRALILMNLKQDVCMRSKT
jgi:hypothetical protein